MRIEVEPGQSLSAAYLWLTKEEAPELRDALVDLLADAGPGWRAHVSSEDFTTEITIGVDE